MTARTTLLIKYGDHDQAWRSATERLAVTRADWIKLACNAALAVAGQG